MSLRTLAEAEIERLKKTIAYNATAAGEHAAKLQARIDELEASARVVVEHARAIKADYPEVCMRAGCDGADCDHEKHPNGHVGLGSSLWPEIETLGKVIDA